MVGAIDALKTGFATLHESEEFSDCKLICGPYHFNLHKVVLSSQSAYFKTAFKTGTFKEGESGTIELKAHQDDDDDGDSVCDDPEIVKLMIEYFYHFDYEKGCDCSSSSLLTAKGKTKKAKRNSTATPSDTDPFGFSVAAPIPSPTISPDSMLEHAKVFAMAVKYQVDGLRDLAVSKFTKAVKACWNHEDFAHTIFTVYNSTTDDVRELREIVADTIYEHFDVLNGKDEIDVVVSSTGGLAFSLLKRSLAKSCKQKVHQGQQSRNVYCRACDLRMSCCFTCYNDYTPRCTNCNANAQRV